MSTRSNPIVWGAAFVNPQPGFYTLPELALLRLEYQTPQTVRGVIVEGRVAKFNSSRPPAERGESFTLLHGEAVCIPDAAAWDRAQQAHADLQQALNALADALRDLGRYHDQMNAAGGFDRAPNPLAPSVVSAQDPDSRPGKGEEWQLGNAPMVVPSIVRRPVVRHTNKKLEHGGGSWSFQADHFVCPDDAAWQEVNQLYAATVAAQERWQTLCAELGTYEAALGDGRYSNHEDPDMPKTRTLGPGQPPPAPPPTVPEDLPGWAWKRGGGGHRLLAPDGWTTNWREKPENAVAEARAYLRAQPHEEPMTTATVPAPPEPPGALSAPLQEIARRYVAARRKSGEALLEMAEALAEARVAAQHGDWSLFLQATGTSNDMAERLLNIHRRAQGDPAFADAVRRDLLSPSVAGLLARPSTPDEVIEQAISSPAPPTTREVERAIAAAKAPEIRNAADSVVPQVQPLPPHIRPTLEAQGWRFAGGGINADGELYYHVILDGHRLTKTAAGLQAMIDMAQASAPQASAEPDPSGAEATAMRQRLAKYGYEQLTRVDQGWLAYHYDQSKPKTLRTWADVVALAEREAQALPQELRDELTRQGWSIVDAGWHKAARELRYAIVRGGSSLSLNERGLRELLGAQDAPKIRGAADSVEAPPPPVATRPAAPELPSVLVAEVAAIGGRLNKAVWDGDIARWEVSTPSGLGGFYGSSKDSLGRGMAEAELRAWIANERERLNRFCKERHIQPLYAVGMSARHSGWTVVDKGRMLPTYAITSTRWWGEQTWNGDQVDALLAWAKPEAAPTAPEGHVLLPPFPVADRDQLHEEIRLVLGSDVPQHCPLVAGLLRAVGRYLLSVEDEGYATRESAAA